MDGLVILMSIRDKWDEDVWRILEKNFIKNINLLEDNILLRGIKSLVKGKRINIELW